MRQHASIITGPSNGTLTVQPVLLVEGAKACQRAAACTGGGRHAWRSHAAAGLHQAGRQRNTSEIYNWWRPARWPPAARLDGSAAHRAQRRSCPIPGLMRTWWVALGAHVGQRGVMQGAPGG